MTRFVPKFAKKAGLKPGSVVYVGRQRDHKTALDLIEYDRDNHVHKDLDTVNECFPFADPPTISWLKVNAIHEVDIINEVGAHLDLHPLILEDIVNTSVRPALEDLGDKMVVILKRLYLSDDEGKLTSEQMSVIFTANAVVSFQEREGSPFGAVRERLRKTVPRVRFLHTDYLAYTLLDALVDDYYHTMERIGDRLDDIQDELIASPTKEHLTTIFEIKRELLLFRRAVWPLREVIGNLTRSDSNLIHESTDPYLRDLYDHTIQVIDTVETLRDMASGLLDIYLSSVSNRMNEVMKVLTIIGVIFIPLGFFAGVYGMNFDTAASPFNLPELSFKYGYLMFWGIVLTIAASLIVYFKRKNWL